MKRQTDNDVLPIRLLAVDMVKHLSQSDLKKILFFFKIQDFFKKFFDK